LESKLAVGSANLNQCNSLVTKSPRLSPDERIALIAQLWDSLDDHHMQLTLAQQVELERRSTTLDDDRTHSVTWEILKAELEKRCP
jgi:putative addiction module component (TIGR02574 family)